MNLGLAGDFLLLVGIWILFVGVLVVFLRGSSLGIQFADQTLKIRPMPALESNAGIPNEKRLYQRKSLPLAVTYSVIESPEHQGTTLSRNVSKGGVCIPLPASLTEGSKLRLDIQLPRIRRPLSIWGEVVWQSILHPTARYETGVRFVQLNTKQILAVARSL